MPGKQQTTTAQVQSKLNGTPPFYLNKQFLDRIQSVTRAYSETENPRFLGSTHVERTQIFFFCVCLCH